MALPTQPYKGARDFYPEDKRLQKYMFGLMRRVAERFGYEEYDAPVLEPLELYLAKTGEEIVNEQTYAFTDRGGRHVAVRPEMTPTVSRMVAGKRQELAYPLRWYSIPNLWRYERPQRGRLREHWQLNVDIFGVEGHQAEAEVIQVADGILKAAGATHDMYSIKVNSRKLMNFIFHQYLGLNEVQAHTMAKLIDRMHKIPHEAFIAETDALFAPSQREQGASNKLIGLLKTRTIEHLPEVIRQHSSALELQELLRELREAKIHASFDLTIMRGFDYYTGIVFEIFDENPDNNRSMLGGGRYDGLVGLFGVEPVPTVGFGFGDVTFQNFLEGHDLLPPLRSETDVYIVIIGDALKKGAMRVVNELRENGVNVAVDISGGKTEKQLKTAVKKGIHYALFIGERELQDEQYEIKNLLTGVSERHSSARIVSIVKDYRGDD
jgi:histidyl-tRNA synthetase